MKFGYFSLTDNPPGYAERRVNHNQLVLDVVEQAVTADGLGFHSAWLPEHHFGLFGVLPVPSQALSFIAALTSRIRLAPGTVVLPINNPVRMAEEYALLDLLSNGRAIFCAGRGYDEREYRGFETPFEESRTRFDEELLLVRKLLSETDVTWHGQHHLIEQPITTYPRPVQQPHPPIYVACFSEPTMRMAAENGFHIIFAPFAAAMMFGSLAQAVARFKELATAAGFPESRAMCSYFTCLADTETDVRQAQERLLFYLKNIAPAFPSNPETAPPHIRYFIDIVDRINRMQPEDLGERSIVTGTREQVTEHLRRVEAAGIDEVICYFNFGLLPHDQTLHQMQRFAAEVMPAFEAAPALSA
jgi:alkanesulfonate monooxygenase SsuD/methylene tetrahydromethanopterin reductase-like flavin-dependent oxidoreductase (luciferase family)